MTLRRSSASQAATVLEMIKASSDRRVTDQFTEPAKPGLGPLGADPLDPAATVRAPRPASVGAG